jgi:hypothetical protein
MWALNDDRIVNAGTAARCGCNLEMREVRFVPQGDVL